MDAYVYVFALFGGLLVGGLLFVLGAWAYRIMNGRD